MSTITTAGNLAADPELRYTPAGVAVVNFVVLENQPRKTDDGSWEDGEPNRFRVTAWRSLAENIAASAQKGDRLTVTGRIKTERYHDRDSGEARTAVHIEADEVGYSLRFHTVRATPAPRLGSSTAAVEDTAADESSDTTAG